MLDVFAPVKRLAADYRTLAEAYDEELAAAHKVEHDTLEALEHLRKANAMAPYVLDVLSRYQAAVVALAEAIANEPPITSCWHSQGRAESLGRYNQVGSKSRLNRLARLAPLSPGEPKCNTH